MLRSWGGHVEEHCPVALEDMGEQLHGNICLSRSIEDTVWSPYHLREFGYIDRSCMTRTSERITEGANPSLALLGVRGNRGCEETGYQEE